MKQPFISVILPVFNGEDSIKNAIDSVLNQKHKAGEIIVVNDGSTDKTAEILNSYGDKIRCFHQENLGPNKARNAGIRASKGDYIAFIDHDDLLFEDAFENHIKYFGKYIDLGVSHGYVKFNQIHKSSDQKSERMESKTIPVLLLQCSLFKKSVFDEIGLFDEDLFLGSDLDMFLRVKEAKIPFAFHNDLVAVHNRHFNNSTNDKRKAQLYLLKVFKKAKERRKNMDMIEFTKSVSMTKAENARTFWHTAILK